MIILHIVGLRKNPFSGIEVVVPEHIKHQQEFADVALLNICNVHIEGIKNQFYLTCPFGLGNLPKPFNKPDLVVFHSTYIPKYLRISSFLRRHGIPYIIIPHGGLTFESQKSKYVKKILGNLFLFKKHFEGAIGIQCLSQLEFDKTDFGKNKFIATNGICLPAKSKKYNFESKSDILFTYIGRIDTYHKGLDLLISAIRQNKDYIIKKSCHFWIYGPDHNGDKNRLESMIKEAGLSEIIVLKDGVIGLEKENILLKTDVFIQTSRSEGMPMGILEAMSYGLPCLVTEGTTLGSKIMEYDAGWVAETNVRSIGLSIVEIINSFNSVREKSSNAIRLIEENFVWKKISFETINQYQKILKEGDCSI